VRAPAADFQEVNPAVLRRFVSLFRNGLRGSAEIDLQDAEKSQLPRTESLVFDRIAFALRPS